jgi:phenylalanyl-tRNA synthetase beta subunit
LPRFPKLSQDITLKVPANVSYQTLFDTVSEALHTKLPKQTVPHLSPVDIYQKEDDPDHKQITLRLTIASYERTLTDTEVNSILDAVAAKARIALSAERL